jgi:hypothetical protein
MTEKITWLINESLGRVVRSTLLVGILQQLSAKIDKQIVIIKYLMSRSLLSLTARWFS